MNLELSIGLLNLRSTILFSHLAKIQYYSAKMVGDKRLKGPPPNIIFQADQIELVQSFWRALCNLESQKYYHYSWQFPFPTRQMRSLEKLLNSGEEK
jgi:hypothetical protein